MLSGGERLRFDVTFYIISKTWTRVWESESEINSSLVEVLRYAQSFNKTPRGSILNKSCNLQLHVSGGWESVSGINPSLHFELRSKHKPQGVLFLFQSGGWEARNLAR